MLTDEEDAILTLYQKTRITEYDSDKSNPDVQKLEEENEILKKENYELRRNREKERGDIEEFLRCLDED